MAYDGPVPLDSTAMADAVVQSGTEAARAGMTSEELANLFKTEIADHETESGALLDKIKIADELIRCVPTDVEGLPKGSVFAETSTLDFFTMRETSYANLYHALLSERPYFMATAPDLDEARVQASGEWQHLLEHQAREGALEEKFGGIFLRDLVTNGTAIGGTPWDVQYRWNDLGKTFEPEPYKDGPGFDNVNLLDFNREPHAPDIEKASWVNEQRLVHPDEVRKMFASARLIPGAVVDEPAFDECLRHEANSPSLNERQDALRQSRGYQQTGKSNYVHLDIRWGFHPAKKDQPIIWKFVTINRRYTIIQHPNPFVKGFKPYIRAVYIPQGQCFYGIGHVHILHRSQVELNTQKAIMRNKIILAGMGMMQSEGGIQDPDKKLEPGLMKILRVEDIGVLKPMLFDLSDLAAMASMENGQRVGMQNAVVANDTAQAQITGATKFEIQEVSTASLKRNQPTAQQVAAQSLRPLLKRWMDLDLQFMPEMVMAYILGTDGRMKASMIQKSNLKANADVFPVVALDLDFAIATQRRLTSFLQTIFSAAKESSFFAQELMESGFTARPFIEKIGRTFGIKPTEIYNPALAQERKARMMIQQAQQEAAAQALPPDRAAPPGDAPPPEAVPPPMLPETPVEPVAPQSFGESVSAPDAEMVGMP